MNQEDLIKQLGVSDYTSKDGKITINEPLSLSSLTELHPETLKGATINGGLYLHSLKEQDRKTAENNVSRLKEGYNKEQGYCFFDGILSKVLKVSKHKGYTIYETPFEFVAQQDKYTAHGKTIKQAIQDLEFKKIAEKLKNEPIKANLCRDMFCRLQMAANV